MVVEGGKTMNMGAIATILSIITGLSGLILGWIGKASTTKKEAVDKTKEHAEKENKLQSGIDVIITKLGFIEDNIKDVKAEQRAMRTDIRDLDKEQARQKDSLKRAHDRIDSLENMFQTILKKLDK